MSAARTFFDSNIVLYLLSDDESKADRAESLLLAGGVVSVQVLNEVASVARRKLALSWTEVDDLLSAVKARCEVFDVTIETHDAGLQIARDMSVSLYDSMIVASALIAGCTTLYSEDMQHGLLVQRQLRVTNPFAH